MIAQNEVYLANLYQDHNNALLEQHKALIAELAENCVAAFYAVLLSNRSTKKFITTDLVEAHLKDELQGWLLLTFSAKYNEEEIQKVIDQQQQVGRVHARIEVPMTLVNTAMQVIKNELFKNIAARPDMAAEKKLELIIVLNKLMDSSLSLINECYMEDKVNNERAAQEYRSNTSAHEIAIELERVKGHMLGWMAQFMTNIIAGKGDYVDDIKQKEFAMWIRHKLGYSCRDKKLINQANTLMDKIESEIGVFPELTTVERQVTVLSINKLITECAWILGQISEMNIESAAREDLLTGLIERRFLTPIIQNEIQLALKTKRHFSTLMIDLDNFKTINDIHGHQAGDKVLAMVGRTLKNALRVTDYAFRYGGEEFLLLLPETCLEDAKLAAQKLLNKIRELEIVLENGRNLKVTISIGIAEFDDHPDFEYLIKHADEKLYLAKHNGKDRYES